VVAAIGVICSRDSAFEEIGSLKRGKGTEGDLGGAPPNQIGESGVARQVMGRDVTGAIL
jgi:hypothetical protein